MESESASAPLCEACGYNLTGLTGNICPECGCGFTISAFEQSRIPWARRAAIGKSRAYWLTLLQVLLHPAAIPRRAGDDVTRVMDDADAFRGSITWLVSLSTGIMLALASCIWSQSLWEIALIFTVGTPLAAIITAVALTAAIECTRIYRVQFPENNLQYMSESLLYYGFAPLALLPLSVSAGFVYGILRESYPGGTRWAVLGLIFPFFVSWISVIRLTRAVTGGSPHSIGRVVLLVPLAWMIIAALWVAVSMFIVITVGAYLRS